MPSGTVVGQVQQAKMYLKFRKPLLKNRINRVSMGGMRSPGFWTNEISGFRGLDSRPAAGSQRPFGWLCQCVLQKWFGLGKMQHAKAWHKNYRPPQPFKERYRRIPPHLYERWRLTSKRCWRWGQSGGVSVLGPVLWCWLGRKMEDLGSALTWENWTAEL